MKLQTKVRHANLRAGQSVDIQPWVDQILEMHGCENHLVHGGLSLRMTPKNLRLLERELGPKALSRLVGWLSRCALDDRATGRAGTSTRH